MQLILLVVIEIITKKGPVRMIVIVIVIKTEIAIGMDTGHGTGIALNVTTVIAKIGRGTVMIVIGRIEIEITMEIESLEDLEIETMIEMWIMTGVTIEIETGTMTIKTEQDIAKSGIGRGATLMTITVMKLYKRFLFCCIIFNDKNRCSSILVPFERSN